MKIYTEIIGNLDDPAWRERAEGAEIETIDLDQWTAQKSRFVVRSDGTTNMPWRSSAIRNCSAATSSTTGPLNGALSPYASP